MTKHIAPQGQSLIAGGHTCNLNGECVCNPTRFEKAISRSAGKRGSHQGYRYEVTFQHNLIEKEK